MGIQFFGQRFEYKHEWEQFKEIRYLLKNYYDNKDELVYVLFNLHSADKLGRCQTDVVLLTKKGPMILELKSYKGKIVGNENSDWKVKNESGEVPVEEGNVYRQLDRQKYALREKIFELVQNKLVSEDKSFFYIKCCAYFQKGSVFDSSQLDYTSKKWFSVITADELLDEIYYIDSARNWSLKDMDAIVTAIGLPPYPPPTKPVKLEKWLAALESYSYPVNLENYRKSQSFHPHFQQKIVGDRKSTIEFEKYFRENTQNDPVVYCEVLFWKLYSLIMKRDSDDSKRVSDSTANNLDRWIEFIKGANNPSLLFDKIKAFCENPSKANFKEFRALLGINSQLPVASTFPAFFSPDTYPILDSHITHWIKLNYSKHNEDRENKLTQFIDRSSDFDFDNYMNWIKWCRDSAEYLTEKTNIPWRARDVEMAVFVADSNHIELEVLKIPP